MSPLRIQWLFVAIFGVLILRVVFMALKGTVPRNRAIIWCGVWGSGLLMVVHPALSERLAMLLGVTRGVDAVIYIAIALLSVFLFRAFALLDTLDRQVSQLTTELALFEWEQKKSEATE